MADFEPAVTALLKREGGLEENPNDAGGITNFGISFRLYKSLYPEAIENDIRKMTPEQAMTVYKKVFWDACKIAFVKNQIIANSLFDAMVNMGIAEAVKIAQRACNSVLANHQQIRDDGVLGAVTLDAINGLSFVPLRTAIRSERAAFYRELVARNPSQEVFLNGWLSRAYSV